MRIKENHGVINGHIQHFGDGLVFKTNVQRFLGVARAVAGLASHKNIRQEMHFNFAHALALARLAASALHVE